MSNYISLADHLPWVFVFGFLATQVIPYLSALATKAPSWATSAVTGVLSFVDALLSQLSQADFHHADWKTILLLSFGYTVTAFAHHRIFIHATDVQTWLHAHGNSLAGDAPQNASPGVSSPS